MTSSQLFRTIRFGAWSIVAVVGFVAAAIAIGWWQVDGPGRPTPRLAIEGLPQMGGPFALTDHRGRRITDRDLRGRPALVFFGFTHCPDVCPTTLFELTNRLKVLGAEGQRLQVVFITADPERDTPEQMALYLQSFDPRIIGLSGTHAEIEQALASYKAVGRKVPQPGGGYSVDHTASVYMIDSAGRFAGLIDHHEDEQMAIAKMRRLAAK